MKASEIGLPTHEASVSCGQWCLGGTVNMTPTAYAEHEDAEFVWVRGDVAGAALSALRSERDELIGMREEVLHYQREFHRLRDERDEAVALLRYVCSLHPDDCGCSGCKFAFLAKVEAKP